MTSKLVSLFSHPEFVRRSQARAAKKLAEQVLGSGSPDDDPPELDAIEAFLDQLFCEKK
jgi:hypothetical protein